MRVAETGERTAALALAEIGVYLALTAIATWVLENRLLREALGYLRGAPPAGAPA